MDILYHNYGIFDVWPKSPEPYPWDPPGISVARGRCKRSQPCQGRCPPWLGGLWPAMRSDILEVSRSWSGILFQYIAYENKNWINTLITTYYIILHQIYTYARIASCVCVCLSAYFSCFDFCAYHHVCLIFGLSPHPDRQGSLHFRAGA